MIQRCTQFYVGLLVAMSMALLSGCNQESETSQSAEVGTTGSVAVLITDAPIDDFDQFWLTVTEVSLLGDEGGVALFAGSKTINLLDLNSHADLFSLADNIPAGSYYKIRMQVENPQLVRLDGLGNVLETVVPNMSASGKLDLNPRSDIVVVAGETLALQIDLDVKKSIHLIQNKKGEYRFRPVVFVDVLTQEMTGKLVRVKGVVDDVNEYEGSFKLCQTGMVVGRRGYHVDHDEDTDDEEHDKYDYDDERDHHHQPTLDHCINVSTSMETDFFDESGEAVTFVYPQDYQQLTVLGYYQDLQDTQIGLDAQVVELAPWDTFKQFMGIVESIDLDNQQFQMRASNDELVTVQLSEAGKIFSMSGMMLSQDELQLDLQVKVEGVFYEVDALIKAAVIFIDEQTQAVDKLSGAIVALHDDMQGFDMTDAVLGDRCTMVNQDSNIYLLSMENGSFSSQQVNFSALQLGQKLDVYGSFNLSGCFVADNILLEAL